MRKYKVLATWEGNDVERELLGLKWSNGESKWVDAPDVEESSHGEDFMRDDIMSIDTGSFKFGNRSGFFKIKDISIYWYVERKDGEGYGDGGYYGESIPFEEYMKLDMYYIEHWSMLLDIQILFKTIGVVLSKRGAY